MDRKIGAILLILFLCAFAVGADAAGEPGSQEAQEVRIPRTAAEHRAMAQSYRTKAANYERDSQEHRLMCEGYKFKVSIPGSAMAAGSSMREAQRDCARYMHDAKELADSAKSLAEYHTARANELEGHP